MERSTLSAQSLYLFFSIIFCSGISAFAQNGFITTWETTQPNETITLPVISGLNEEYTVDWGDAVETGLTGQTSHTYAMPGNHTIEITGDFHQIQFTDSPDAHKILVIESWGDTEWRSFSAAFNGCVNLQVNATDAPNISPTDDQFSMASMFRGCANLNPSNLDWDVSEVTTMYAMFEGASQFNTNISMWEVSLVTDMSQMFLSAETFDQDLSGWNFGSVNMMANMLLPSGMSNDNYANLISAIYFSNSNQNVELGVGAYLCDPLAITQKNELIDQNNWIIIDSGDCIQGCTDVEACNFDSSANEDDGSCLYLDCADECGGSAVEDECGVCNGLGNSCFGCTDLAAVNYDNFATMEDNSCVYCDLTAAEQQIGGSFVSSSLVQRHAQTFITTQAIQSPLLTLLINLTETEDNQIPYSGSFYLTTVDAQGEPNWDDQLVFGDFYPEDFSTTGLNQAYIVFMGFDLPQGEYAFVIEDIDPHFEIDIESSDSDPYASGSYWTYDMMPGTEQSQEYEITDLFFQLCGLEATPGCTNPMACNYDPLATTNNGSCVLPDGCTDSSAINYTPLASCDDGTCKYGVDICGECTLWDDVSEKCIPDETCYPCFGDANLDGQITAADLTEFLSVFGESCD